MKILDQDIQDIIATMSKEELNELSDYSDYYFDGDVDIIKLKEQLEKMNKQEQIEILKEDIEAANNKIPERRISILEFKKIINRAELMNPGKKFISEMSGMSKEQLDKYYRDKISKKMLDDSKYTTDSKYGISTIDKANIIRILKGKAEVKEMVNQLPKKDFKSVKEKFEYLRNNPKYMYNSANKELKEIIKDVFGKEDFEYLNECAIVDFGEAFDAREKELLPKEKKGFFAKIKNLFTKQKQKALPEGKEIASEKDSRQEEFMSRIKIDTNTMDLNRIINNSEVKDRAKDDMDDRYL